MKGIFVSIPSYLICHSYSVTYTDMLNVQANRHFSSKGRYAEFYHEPVIRLLRFVTEEKVFIKFCCQPYYHVISCNETK